MINPSLPGASNPAAAKAAKLRHELEAKAASRRYAAHCAECGIGAFEARLLAPELVKKGDALRAVEARRLKQEQLKQRKARLEQRFGRGTGS